MASGLVPNTNIIVFIIITYLIDFLKEWSRYCGGKEERLSGGTKRYEQNCHTPFKMHLIVSMDLTFYDNTIL